MQPDLQNVAAQFDHWRRNKATLGNKTPVALRQLAVELTQHYSVSKVVSTLNLSGTIINAWRKALYTTPRPVSQTNNSFVTLPASSTLKTPSLTFDFPQGGCIEMSADLHKAFTLRHFCSLVAFAIRTCSSLTRL